MKTGQWAIPGIRAIAVASIAAGAIASAQARESRTWTLVELGTLGGPGSYGAAISDNGMVAGCSDTPSGAIHAFIYRDGAMRDLDAGMPTNSCALAVNNAGVVAGRVGPGDLAVWNGTSVTMLGVQGDVGGISESGVIVGSQSSSSGATRAFSYHNGTLVALGGDYTTARAINARGDVAGTSNGEAFVYRNGTVTMLGTLGGNRSEARAINSFGEVVGLATEARGMPQSFRYDGTMRAISAPNYSSAVGINDAGQVIGSAEGTHGYVIDNGTYYRLDKLPSVLAKGWRHMEPTGINNGGAIVGTGTDADGNLRAFVLIPSTLPVAGGELRNPMARDDAVKVRGRVEK